VSRDFSKDVNNWMGFPDDTVGTHIDGAGEVSMHLWGKADTYTTSEANQNRMIIVHIDGTSAGVWMSINATGANDVLRLRARSETGETLESRNGSNDLPTGSWHSFGSHFDFAGDVMTPYANGAADNGGAETFDATSYTHASPTVNVMIGADDESPATNNQWDGLLAEIAVWKSGLTAGEFLLLSKGASALFIQPHNLVFYAPMWGSHAPEINLMTSDVGTITGTIAKGEHPPVFYPSVPFLGMSSGNIIPEAFMYYQQMMRHNN